MSVLEPGTTGFEVEFSARLVELLKRSKVAFDDIILSLISELEELGPGRAGTRNWISPGVKPPTCPSPLAGVARISAPIPGGLTVLWHVIGD
jgi:hypothetical protein